MLTTTSTFPPTTFPNVPYNIYKEWCMGDSLDVINANFKNFDDRLVTLSLSSEQIKSQFAATTPPGAVLPFARRTPPDGWLECNGQRVDVNTYSNLANVIYVGDAENLGTNSTFGYRVNSAGLRVVTGNFIVLPDLRGYFVRGYGTNSDSTASFLFGAKQADALQSHLHTFGYRDDTDDSQNNGVASGTDNVMSNPIGITRATGGPITDLAFTGNVRADSETRPRNIPLLYCIKY